MRAYTIKNKTKAWGSRCYYTDFERGFIKVEVISFADYQNHWVQNKLGKENGKMRLEGKEYVVEDGDVMHFKLMFKLIIERLKMA